MKHLYLLLLPLLLLSCQQDSTSVDTSTQGRIDVLIGSPDLSRAPVGATAEEKLIQQATVALYDNKQAYLTHQTITANTQPQATLSFTGIAHSSLPVTAVVVANTVGAWELTGVSSWPATTATTPMSITNKATAKELQKASTPLAMCGSATATAAGTLTVPLRRPMAKLVLTNRSNVTIDYIAFSELNATFGTAPTFTPPATSEAFTLTESPLLFASGSSRTYYFMPTAASQALLEFRSGATTKRVQLKTITSNAQHPIEVTIDPAFNIDITITVPDNWEEDDTQIL
ncbi:MAG: FimB/Mfa2 family fimbrial subunit [Mucinivorans sp.]